MTEDSKRRKMTSFSEPGMVQARRKQRAPKIPSQLRSRTGTLFSQLNSDADAALRRSI